MAKPTRTDEASKPAGARFKAHRNMLRISTGGLAVAFGLKGVHYLEKIERGERAAMPWMWTLLRIWTSPLCPAEFRPPPSARLLQQEAARLEREAEALLPPKPKRPRGRPKVQKQESPAP